MLAALPFPTIDPVIFAVEIGDFTLALRWYAMAYILGIVIGWRMGVMIMNRPHLWRDGPPMTAPQAEDMLTWIILGIVVGGRLGYVLFYQPAYYLANPLEIPAIWQGGMSFHGGFLGVMAAVWWNARRYEAELGSVADALALCTPPGLLLGRIANFINAELWGRPSDVAWAVEFPGAAAQDCPGVEGICARHPSQLYEAGLEGLVLGAMLIWLAFFRGALKTPWRLTGLFFLGYGLARTVVEAFRQADPQYITEGNPLGHVIRLGEAGLTMGQVLSLPMVAIGIALLIWSRRRA
ncbi:MAG: prolipoprotein diacylglyceryl transferase [Rhodobacter sp.]|nr:prolipoprotein diacylglyceryl transferase [Rhodobacter sp.]